MAVKEKSWCKLSLDSLVPAEWNYKEEDQNKIKKLKNNLKRNGQVENIIVRKLETGFYEVVNGNHRLQAFGDAGINEPVCFNLGVVSDAKAKRLAVETNETRFDTNSAKLSAVLEEMLEEGEWSVNELVQTMPYNVIELEEMLSFGGPTEGIDEDDEDDNKSGGGKSCPKCGYEF